MARSGPFHSNSWAFGCQYSKLLISNAATYSQPTALAAQLTAIIATDLQLLQCVLNLCLDYFNDKSAQKHHPILKAALKSIVHRFGSSTAFHSIVINFFNEQPDFPFVFLTSIARETAFELVIDGCNSKFGDDARSFLETSILPGLASIPNFFVDNDLLFELCALRIPGFNPASLFQRAPSMDLVVFSDEFCGDRHEELKLDKLPITTTLQSVLIEGPPSTLTSAAPLRNLFEFFPAFDHNHAAVFLLTIVSPSSAFCVVSDAVIRDIFAEYHIDILKVLGALDQPEFDPLPVDSAISFFALLGGLFDGDLLPTIVFTREWQNKPLQLSFLQAVATTRIPSLDFAKGKTLLSLKELDIAPNTFGHCNNCWLSIEFAQRIVHLTKDDPTAIAGLFGPLQVKSPALVLAILGQLNAPRTPAVMGIAIEALTKVMQSASKQDILSYFLRTAAGFVKAVIVAFYTKQPGRIDLIYEAFHDHVGVLYEVDNLPFVVDLAIQAVVDGGASFTDFLGVYVARYQSAVIPRIADFLKTKVTESMAASSTIVSDAILNCFFQYLADTFETYNIEVRAFIQRVYLSCLSTRTKLKRIQFDIKYSANKLQEIKMTASKHYGRLLGDDICLDDFISQFKKCRTEDPKLFSCMVYFLVKEFNFLDQHTLATVEKLAEVISRLLLENLLTGDTKTKMLRYFVAALSDSEQTVKSHFATKVVALILPKLGEENQFVCDLVQNSALRSLNPPLFEKVKKLMQEPTKASVSKGLLVHPLLRRFESLQSPPPRVCKAVQLIQKESSNLAQFLANYRQYSDWFALHIVRSIQDQSKLALSYLPQINEAGGFWKIVYQAAVFQAFQLILSPKIDAYDGALVRRRLLLLGKLIGDLTIAVDRPLLARFLDVKKLLLYAFLQGKLYGIVPFVTAIVAGGSVNYSARNPFVASILQILAAILKTNSIKLFIKNHIQALFSKLGVSLGRFATLPVFFPEKIQNNFDFLLPPFSLTHLASAADAERIATFDENTFAAFVAPHFVIPDTPAVARSSDKREHMRAKLNRTLFDILKSDGQGMAEIAVSTATELILKDFLIAAETEQMIEDAIVLTKQLVSGLNLFTAPARIARQFCLALKKDEDASDGDWIELIAEKNYEWFIQLLRDVVELRSLKLVQTAVEKSDETRMKMLQSRRSRSIPAMLQPTKQGLTSQQQQIYWDLNDLSLSQQPYPILDMQGKDKQAKTDPEFETYLTRFQKQLQLEYSRSDQLDEQALSLLDRCPTLNDKITIDRFRLILKTILRSVNKVNQPVFEKIVCQILSQIIQCVPRQMLARTQDFLLGMIRTTLKSPVVICEFLKLRMLQIGQLDQLFTDLLDTDPFNARNAWFVVKFLKVALLDHHLFSENDVLSTLSVLCSVNRGLLEGCQTQSCLIQWFDDLQKLFENMDSPSLHLSSASRLQFVSTFDPLEDIQDSRKITDAIGQWKQLLHTPPQTELELEEMTKTCASLGKNLYLSFFFSESEKLCLQFLSCVIQFVGITDELTDAVIAVVGGNATVVGFDFRKYYSILRLLMESCDDGVRYALLLHTLRPAVMPSFSFNWIELATDKNLVFALLQNRANWPSFAILLLDFAAVVSFVDPKESQEAFGFVYKSFLRFILVLAHDFPDFVSAVASVLVSVIPFRFVQVRNLVLSTVQRNVPPIFSVAELAKMLPPRFTAALSQLFTEGSFDSAVLNSVLTQMENKCDPSFVRLFVGTICEGAAAFKKGEAVEAVPGFVVLNEAFGSILPDLAFVIVNTLVDSVRCKGRESAFFVRLIHSLFRTEIMITPQLSLSEAIVRVVMERASTPPPRPHKLKSLVRALLAEGSGRDVWTMPFVTTNKNVRDFLVAAQTVYGKPK
jgi:CCR4-NOT transcription complex subunit 1